MFLRKLSIFYPKATLYQTLSWYKRQQLFNLSLFLLFYVGDGNAYIFLLLIITFVPGRGPFPGVLYMYGLSKTIWDHIACCLASYGFAALHLLYIYHEHLPMSFKDVEAEYFFVSPLSIVLKVYFVIMQFL